MLNEANQDGDQWMTPAPPPIPRCLKSPSKPFFRFPSKPFFNIAEPKSHHGDVNIMRMHILTKKAVS